MLTNVGGALGGSAVKGENPNAGMGGAAAGTVLGYGLGKAVEIPFNNNLNPWYRPDWKDAGIGFGIVKPNPPSVLPPAGRDL